VRELNLIIGNQKNGSKIKEAFIMANKCQVYNDCITMISHKRIELLDQVCIKVYDGENLVKHIRNAEL